LLAIVSRTSGQQAREFHGIWNYFRQVKEGPLLVHWLGFRISVCEIQLYRGN